MLTGKELGAAIKEALAQNGKSQADAAQYFGIKAPSVSGWIKTGRISKANFDALRVWLTKTPPEHWGAASAPIGAPMITEREVPKNHVSVDEISELIGLYGRSDRDGRDSILRAARIAADLADRTGADSMTTNDERKRSNRA